jgi:prolyl-tRNA synthetase
MKEWYPMIMTHMMLKTEKDVSTDVQLRSHRWLLRAGFMKQIASGIYSLTPLAHRVLQQIANVAREEMNALGGQEVLMPIVQPATLWQESGRLESIPDELMRLNDRAGQPMVLAMTHEEAVTDLARHFIQSYRQLPQMVYQVQTKIRDEPRPRGGLVRLREFQMKDAYSFHATQVSLELWYKQVAEAYAKFYARCGVKALCVESDSGMMGGRVAHEYMVLSSGGEDTLLICPNCHYAANLEVAKSISTPDGEVCAHCQTPLTTTRGIEVGNIFQLGTKYSQPMNATFTDESGSQQPFLMGCYGIGITRMLACIVEENCDEKGMVWPVSVAPFSMHLVPIGPSAEVVEIWQRLEREFGENRVLVDNRDVSPGVKFADADLLGMPYRVTVSARSLQAGGVEVTCRKTGVSEIVGVDAVVSGTHLSL